MGPPPLSTTFISDPTSDTFWIWSMVFSKHFGIHSPHRLWVGSKNGKKMHAAKSFISLHAKASKLGKVVKELSQFLIPAANEGNLALENTSVFIKPLSKSESVEYNGGLLWSWDILGTSLGWAYEKEWSATKASSAFSMKQQIKQAPIATEAVDLPRESR